MNNPRIKLHRRGFAWLAAAVCVIAVTGEPAAGAAGDGYDPARKDRYVAVVLTEAAGEKFAGQVAVAEVLRNRDWDTRAFMGLRRKNLAAFLRRHESCRPQAVRAIETARRGSNLTRGATHFDNTVEFGWPDWAHEMVVTARIGHHTFFRSLN